MRSDSGGAGDWEWSGGGVCKNLIGARLSLCQYKLPIMAVFLQSQNRTLVFCLH